MRGWITGFILVGVTAVAMTGLALTRLLDLETRCGSIEENSLHPVPALSFSVEAKPGIDSGRLSEAQDRARQFQARCVRRARGMREAAIPDEVVAAVESALPDTKSLLQEKVRQGIGVDKAVGVFDPVEDEKAWRKAHKEKIRETLLSREEVSRAHIFYLETFRRVQVRVRSAIEAYRSTGVWSPVILEADLPTLEQLEKVFGARGVNVLQLLAETLDSFGGSTIMNNTRMDFRVQDGKLYVEVKWADLPDPAGVKKE